MYQEGEAYEGAIPRGKIFLYVEKSVYFSQLLWESLGIMSALSQTTFLTSCTHPPFWLVLTFFFPTLN